MQLETKLHTCKSVEEYAMIHRVGLMLCSSTDSEKYPTKTLDRISGYKYIAMSLLIRGPKLLWFILPACLAVTLKFFGLTLNVHGDYNRGVHECDLVLSVSVFSST